MNSPRRPALAGPMPTGHGHHHHMGPGSMSSRKQSSSSGSSPVGSTRSVVFEDQDPLLPHNHKNQRASRPPKKQHQPLPNQRKNLHYWPPRVFFCDCCTILSVAFSYILHFSNVQCKLRKVGVINFVLHSFLQFNTVFGTKHFLIIYLLVSASFLLFWDFWREFGALF